MIEDNVRTKVSAADQLLSREHIRRARAGEQHASHRDSYTKCDVTIILLCARESGVDEFCDFWMLVFGSLPKFRNKKRKRDRCTLEGRGQKETRRRKYKVIMVISAMSTDSYAVTSYETEINREIRSHSPTLEEHPKSLRPRPSDEERRLCCVARRGNTATGCRRTTRAITSSRKLR